MFIPQLGNFHRLSNHPLLDNRWQTHMKVLKIGLLGNHSVRIQLILPVMLLIIALENIMCLALFRFQIIPQISSYPHIDWVWESFKSCYLPCIETSTLKHCNWHSHEQLRCPLIVVHAYIQMGCLRLPNVMSFSPIKVFVLWNFRLIICTTTSVISELLSLKSIDYSNSVARLFNVFIYYLFKILWAY